MTEIPIHDEKQNPVAVLYGTFAGHTRVIAERVASDLEALGFPVEIHDFREIPATFDLGRCDAGVVLAPVRLGEHEKHMVEYVKAHRAQLESMPVAFISATLSEVGAERRHETPEQHAKYAADVQSVLDRFFEETGWKPAYVKPVAGAITYTHYNFVVRFLMKMIAKKTGAGTDTSRDYEYTDWDDLDDFVSVFAKAVREARGSAPNRPRSAGSETNT